MREIDLGIIDQIEAQENTFDKDGDYFTLLQQAINQNKVERLYLLINSGHQASSEPESEPEHESMSELDVVKNKLHEIVRTVELSKLILKKVIKNQENHDKFFDFLKNIMENTQVIQEQVKKQKPGISGDILCQSIRDEAVKRKGELEEEYLGRHFFNELQKKIITLILAKFNLPTPKAATTRKRNRERLASLPGGGVVMLSDNVEKNRQWLTENIEILKENEKIDEKEESSLWTSFNRLGGGNFSELKSGILHRLESLYDEKMKPLMEMRRDLESFKNKLLEYDLPTESGQQDVKAFIDDFSKLNEKIEEQEGGKQTLELIDNAGKSFAQLKLDIIEGHIKAVVDYFTTELSNISLDDASKEGLSKKIGELREMTDGGEDALVAVEKINSKIIAFQNQMEVEEEQEKAIKSLREQLTESYLLQVNKAVKNIGRLKGEFQDIRNIARSTKFLSNVSGDGKTLREKKTILVSFEALKESNSEITDKNLLESLFLHCFKEASQDEAKVKALEELGITAAKKTHDLLFKFTGNILSDDTAYQSFMAAIIGVDEAGISVPKNREEKLAELAQQIGVFCCGEPQLQPEAEPAPAMMSP